MPETPDHERLHIAAVLGWAPDALKGLPVAQSNTTTALAAAS